MDPGGGPRDVEPVVVRTADFHLAYHLVTALRELDVPCLQLDVGERLPTPGSIWMGTPEEVGANPVGRPMEASAETVAVAVEAAARLAAGFGRAQALVFGIDPGPRPGLAWLADGVVGGEEQLESIDATVDRIAAIGASLEHDELLVRVGDGAPTIGRRLTNVCLARGLAVEVVDEMRTSHGVPRHQHARSAVRIAALSGQRIEQRQRIEPPKGEVRELQARSRQASGGRVTISEELAQAVAVGRLSMEEAVAEHERRHMVRRRGGPRGSHTQDS